MVITVPTRIITRASRVVTKIQNQHAQIPCTARGIPRPTITWKRKDGQSVTRRATIRNTGTNETTSTITISQVQTKDGGIYICIATNKVTTRPMEQEVTLVVNGNCAGFI